MSQENVEVGLFQAVARRTRTSGGFTDDGRWPAPRVLPAAPWLAQDPERGQGGWLGQQVPGWNQPRAKLFGHSCDVIYGLDLGGEFGVHSTSVLVTWMWRAWSCMWYFTLRRGRHIFMTSSNADAPRTQGIHVFQSVPLNSNSVTDVTVGGWVALSGDQPNLGRWCHVISEGNDDENERLETRMEAGRD